MPEHMVRRFEPLAAACTESVKATRMDQIDIEYRQITRIARQLHAVALVAEVERSRPRFGAVAAGTMRVAPFPAR